MNKKHWNTCWDLLSFFDSLIFSTLVHWVGVTPFVGPGVGWLSHFGGLLTTLVVIILIEDEEK